MCAHRRLLPFRMVCHLLVMASCLCRYLRSVQSQQLSPLSTAVAPFWSCEVDQLIFDPINETLYLGSVLRHTVLQVFQATSLPLTPADAAPWDYSVLAGIDDTEGLPSVTPVPALEALLARPGGIIGWPSYAVGPSLQEQSKVSRSWVGLWVCEQLNHAVRFIQFSTQPPRVLLVAGSPLRVPSFADGVGTAALLSTPVYPVWGRFLMVDAASPSSSSSSFSSSSSPAPSLPSPRRHGWTSVIFWSENWNHCVRQGIPLHNDSSFSPLTGSPSESLDDMVLNVSTFAGLCLQAGNPVGPAYLQPAFVGPLGIALVNSFPVSNDTTDTNGTVMFIGDDWGRISMAAPMYPPSSRYLTTIYLAGRGVGVQVGIMRFQSSTLPPVTTFELFVGADNYRILNISFSLSFDASLPRPIDVVPGSVEGHLMATTSIIHPYSIGLIPHALNNNNSSINNNNSGSGSSSYGTLVTFSGWNNWTSIPVLQFYCCLGVEYSVPTDVGPSGCEAATSSGSMTTTPTTIRSAVTATRLPPSTRTASHPTKLATVPSYHPMTQSRHGLASLSSRNSTTMHSRNITDGATFTLTTTSKIRGARVWGSHSVTRTVVPKKKASIVASVERRGDMIDPTATVPASVVASTTVASVSTAALSSGSSNKAVISGRLVSVWRCAVVGSGQVTATDPQQFLNFGFGAGGDDEEGSARGALLVTSGIRVGLLTGFLLLLKVKYS